METDILTFSKKFIMMNQSNNIIDLVYICSNGRSGSTLLEMMISRSNTCFTVGEFQVLPIDLIHNTQPCGCGVSVSMCNFWNNVLNNDTETIKNSSISRFRNFGAGKVLRYIEILELLTNLKFSTQPKKKYCDENFSILQNVKNEVKDPIKYIVDASKDPYRLKWLTNTSQFNIKVLHIIKQPEAFVYSMTKNELGILKKYLLTIRFSLRWIVENLIISRVIHKYINKTNFKKIRYEEFCTDNVQSMKKIYNFLEIEDQNINENISYFHNNHAISGNKIRFKNTIIKLDEKWKYELSIAQKFIIKLIVLMFYKKIY